MIRRWRPVVAVVALGWLAALAYSSLAGRALYADASWGLLYLLQNPNRFWDYDTQRTFATYIIQAPVLLGQRLGVDSIRGYAALYALGLYVVPALLMLASLFLARAQPLLFAANAFAVLVFGFGTNFVPTEANLLFGFAWLCATILALDRPAPVLRGIVLPIVAFASTRLYEGMLLAGPLLAAWAFVAASRVDLEQRERLGATLAGFLFLWAAVVAFGTALAPRDPHNAAGFTASAFQYLRSPQLFMLLAAAAVFPAVWRPWPRLRWIAAVVSAIFGLLFLVAIARLEGFYAYEAYYRNRSFLTFALPVCVAALFLAYWRRPSWLSERGPQEGYALLLVPFAFVVAADVLGTHRWSAYLDTFCEVLQAEVPPAERLAALKRSGAMTAWPWSHPTMSVLLRPKGSLAMVTNEPGQRFEPIDPSRPPSLPHRGYCPAAARMSLPVAGFEEPISFREGKYPAYVAAVTGLSAPEGWGTWSEGPIVGIRFTRRLPASFDATIRVNTAFAENRRQPVTVRAGGKEATFVPATEPHEATLRFRDIGEADAISLHIPKPQSPKELGLGDDPRPLGIGLASITFAAPR